MYLLIYSFGYQLRPRLQLRRGNKIFWKHRKLTPWQSGDTMLTEDQFEPLSGRILLRLIVALADLDHFWFSWLKRISRSFRIRYKAFMPLNVATGPFPKGLISIHSACQFQNFAVCILCKRVIVLAFLEYYKCVRRGDAYIIHLERMIVRAKPILYQKPIITSEAKVYWYSMPSASHFWLFGFLSRMVLTHTDSLAVDCLNHVSFRLSPQYIVKLTIITRFHGNKLAIVHQYDISFLVERIKSLLATFWFSDSNIALK